MKKIICSLLIALLAIGALAGCNFNSNNTQPTTTVADKAIEMFDSIEDYIKSEPVAQALDGLKQTYDKLNVDLDITAENNKLIYTITSRNAELDMDTVKKNLDSAESTYTTMLEQLQSYVKVSVPSVEVVYCNPDGTVVYSKEFTLDEIATTK